MIRRAKSKLIQSCNVLKQPAEHQSGNTFYAISCQFISPKRINYSKNTYFLKEQVIVDRPGQLMTISEEGHACLSLSTPEQL